MMTPRPLRAKFRSLIREAILLISNPAESVSILGCGWLGTGLAKRLLNEGRIVFGSTTQSAKLARLRQWGIQPTLLRLEDETDETESDPRNAPAAWAEFFSSPTLVSLLPPQTALGSDYHLLQIEQLLHLHQVLARRPLQRFVYVSSVSVYGSTQGEVDENTFPQPDEGSGQILLSAEKRLTTAAQQGGWELDILRAGGLIGPGRHPGRFLTGRTGLRDGESPVNLIHQTDLIECLARLILSPSTAQGSTQIFNAVSNQHPTRGSFYTEATASLGLPPPEFSTAPTTSNKCVHAQKIRLHTGYEFQFDDLTQAVREGRL